jgi:hypothetical protein
VKYAISFLLLLAACGDNLSAPGPLEYTDPGAGKLRLIKHADQPGHGYELVLDLVVGDAPQTGYSVGFDLPLAQGEVTLAAFQPGSTLAGGAGPVAAIGVLPTTGPLKGELVTGQSQKAKGAGAVATDTQLAPGAVLYTIALDPAVGAKAGVVFDGTASSFVLPSGGLRDRTGNTVVDSKDVAIGKLELTRDY